MAPLSAPRATLRTVTYNVLQCSGFWSRDADERAARAFPREEAAERFASALACFEPDIVTFASRRGRDHRGDRGAAGDDLHHLSQPATLAWHPDDSPGRDRGRTARASRAHEQRAVTTAIRDDVDAGRSVVLRGDLNHRPDMPEHACWSAAGLLDAARGAGDEAHSFRSDLPMARLDYIWPRRADHGPIDRGDNLRRGAVYCGGGRFRRSSDRRSASERPSASAGGVRLTSRSLCLGGTAACRPSEGL